MTSRVDLDAKHSFSQYLNYLLSDSAIIGQILFNMHGHIECLLYEHSKRPEPRVMKRYIIEMARCRRLFKNQIMAISTVFDSFNGFLKRNSTIEQLFLHSDAEDNDEEDDGEHAKDEEGLKEGASMLQLKAQGSERRRTKIKEKRHGNKSGAGNAARTSQHREKKKIAKRAAKTSQRA